MLNRFLLLCACALLLSSVSAQEKRDYNWLLGYTPNDSSLLFGGTKIDFNVSPPSITFFKMAFSFTAIAMLSDKDGQLQFYTNACAVANRNDKKMPNGDEINIGFEYNSWCKMADLGYPLHQGVLALPYPGSDHLCIIIHQGYAGNSNQTNELRYSLVDMSADGGLGDVTLKNQLIYIHKEFASNLTAVRHGNGRDWWIIAPKYHSDLYFKFLLTPQGFSGPFTQNFGHTWTLYQGLNQACFSPDGKKYIRAAQWNSGCQIADFDRCTGLLSKPINIPFPKDTFLSTGCAVSPNNRFLYVSADTKIWQFDLEASDVFASRVLVGVYDGFKSPFSTQFFQCMLGPDGKIYITAPNGVNVLHVIHHPNEKGLACNLEQHGIKLFTYHAFSTPNFPHLRLFDLPDSPCDTLGINGGSVSVSVPVELPLPSRLRVLPNPAESGEPIRLEAGDLFGLRDRLFIYSAAGQCMGEERLPMGQSYIELESGTLPPGVYWAVLRRGNGAVQRGQMVVMR